MRFLVAFSVLAIGCSSTVEARPDPVAPTAPVHEAQANPTPSRAPAPRAQSLDFDARLSSLQSARTLRCKFTVAAGADWPNDLPVVSSHAETMTFDFDAINHGSHTARVLGGQGAGDVTVASTRSGIGFVEATSSGNLIMTTVSPWLLSSGDFAAVHSRHISVLDPNAGPVFQQFYGSCKVL